MGVGGPGLHLVVLGHVDAGEGGVQWVWEVRGCTWWCWGMWTQVRGGFSGVGGPGLHLVVLGHVDVS